MNNELKQLIQLVKNSDKPVQTVVENYMKDVVWTILKDEFSRMTTKQKMELFQKLEQERK